MPHVDLAFRVQGTSVPVDHGYSLFSAISRVIPALHGEGGIGVHSMRGRYGGEGRLRLTPSSRLIVRLPADRIGPFLRLAGKRLDVDGCALVVGVPEARALRPASSLYARLVTIKGFMEVEPFNEAANRQLDTIGVRAELAVGRRRTLRVKDKQVVGFEVTASGLDAEDSVRLQEVGVGGRRRMGCGIFLPIRQGGDS
jgi:CRISPR-associated protein Cas6